MKSAALQHSISQFDFETTSDVGKLLHDFKRKTHLKNTFRFKLILELILEVHQRSKTIVWVQDFFAKLFLTFFFVSLKKPFTERFPIVTSRARPRYCASLRPARFALDRQSRVPCACAVIVGDVSVLFFFQLGSFAPFHEQVVRVAFPQAGQVCARGCSSCPPPGPWPEAVLPFFNIHGISFRITCVPQINMKI